MQQKTRREVFAVIQDNLLIYLLANAGLLLVAATVLTELRPLRAIMKRQDRSVPNQLLLGLLFGLLSIASTYTGLSFQGAIVNTRTISTLAAGLVGGPLTGVSAGALSGLHRFFYDPGGFTSLACGLGTFSFGVLGAVYYRWFSGLKAPRHLALVGLTVAAELIQCVIILAVARPFAEAVALEKAILIPKIVVNSLGLVIFSAVMDRMNRSLRIELLEQQHQVELRQQAELRALQSQINPHFLYNSLTTIRWMAAMARAENVCQALFALGNIIRPVFSQPGIFWSLDTEQTFVRNFVDIMDYRFGIKTECSFAIPGELLERPVLRFILQPLVENSFQHGLQSGMDAGRRGIIHIRARQEDSWLDIYVQDNGQGMDGQSLIRLNERLQKGTTDPPAAEPRTGIGLSNVNRRILLQYGEGSGLSVWSQAGQGTTVRIRMRPEPVPPKPSTSH